LRFGNAADAPTPAPKRTASPQTFHAEVLSPADQERRRRLNRMKAVATGALVLMAVIFVIAFSLEDRYPWLGYVRAMAEAGMVGALADWFAVVALFRHPLGVPIPHTAILPANKARVADNLAAFVRDRFLGTEALVDRVNAFDPASRLSMSTLSRALPWRSAS